MAPYKTFLIAGPTASGKSGLAIALAQRFNGVIINTDSMQVYRDLRVLTARPSEGDETMVPHRLYGTIDGAEAFSSGAWLRAVEEMLPDLRDTFQTIVFVGGTGLYFNALTIGLSQIPETPIELRASLRAALEENGPAELHRQLAAEDPHMAARLEPGDGQRIVRALEVLRNTGKSLQEWQDTKTKPLIDLNCAQTKAIILDPDRANLAEKIDQRFRQMAKTGSVEEVAALLKRKLGAELSVMKAIGVSELASYLAGQTALETAMDQAIIASRQYAKRQRTWFRGQMGANWARFQAPDEVLKSL